MGFESPNQDKRIEDPVKAEEMAHAGKDYEDSVLEEKSKGENTEWSRDVANTAEEEAGIRFDEEKAIEGMSLDELKLRTKMHEEKHDKAYKMRKMFSEATDVIWSQEKVLAFKKLLDVDVNMYNALWSADLARIKELEGK